MTVSWGPDRSSRGTFGIWTPGKVADGNNEQQPVCVSTATNGSGSDVVTLQQGRRDRLSARLQRSSSRLLTLLRPRRDSSNVTKESTPESGTTSNQQAGDGFRSSCPVTVKDALVGQNAVTRPQENAPVSSPPSSPHSSSPESPAGPSTELHEKQKEDRPGSEGTHARPESITAGDAGKSNIMQAQQTQPNPNLSALLSSRLSTAFANSTVVHRAHLKPRPSIRTVQDSEASDNPLSKQGDNIVDSFSPSISPSSDRCWSSNPSNPRSTPPTSDESVAPADNSKSPFWTKADSEGLYVCDRPQKKSAPEQGLPTTSPSIVTVEAAANAKVFFETYFNAVLSHVNARSQRRAELEQYLYSLRFTPEEQEVARKTWICQEREYLRQYRVLKTRCHNASPGKTASIANYELIKVLGNGSFGVVSLVREKGNEDNRSSEGGSPAIESGRVNEVKMRNVRARKQSATDGGRSGHRRQTTNMRGIYAMKVIRKAEMLRSSQEGHLRAERDFLVASAKSRWVVPLIASFQDSQNLYLVMEYMIGGDFLGLLMRENILPEPITKWYIAEMILCVEEAHKLHWIHRDVKPDNFLISASGHLKIADFGLAFDGHWAHDQGYYNNHRYSLIKKLGIQIEGDATDREEKEKTKQPLEPVLDTREPPTVDLLGWRDRHQRRRLARSVVGTSQYMAPEVVRGRLYDGRCDWWSVGIILYECLYGFTPFVSDDRFTTKLKIVNHHQILHFPMQRLSDKFVSTDAIDLISQLLQEKEYRLSARNYRLNDLAARSLFPNMDPRYRNYRGMYVCPNDASDIKAHPFFRGINWDALHRSTPPFIPVVRDWDDTQYFEDTYESPPSSTPNIPKTNENTNPETVPEPPLQTAGATPGDMANKAPCGAKTQRKRAKEDRARDKILRDDLVGKTVLEMRQNDAFLGYTYRRPKPVALALNCERGRPLLSRGRLSDLYGC